MTGGKRAGSGRPSQLTKPIHRAYRIEERQAAFLAQAGAKRGTGATAMLRDVIDLAEYLEEAGKLEAMIKKAHG